MSATSRLIKLDGDNIFLAKRLIRSLPIFAASAALRDWANTGIFVLHCLQFQNGFTLHMGNAGVFGIIGT